MQRKILWLKPTCLGDLFDRLIEVAKAVVDFCQAQNVAGRVPFSFRDRRPGFLGFVGSLENVKVLA